MAVKQEVCLERRGRREEGVVRGKRPVNQLVKNRRGRPMWLPKSKGQARGPALLINSVSIIQQVGVGKIQQEVMIP